jgi:hypothetical protein
MRNDSEGIARAGLSGTVGRQAKPIQIRRFPKPARLGLPGKERILLEIKFSLQTLRF